MTGKINNEKDAEKEYLKNIFGYKKTLKRQKIYSASRSNRMLKFIDRSEYIIYGSFFSLNADTDLDRDLDTDLNLIDFSTAFSPNIPPLETEEEAAQRQQGQGLKIMTLRQMITRLPILLAQLKAGNKSQKLKN